MNNNAVGRTWEELEKEIFTPEEIAASDLRVALINEMIKAREAQGISQRKLEELSGVAQPVIARMEKGTTSPSIDTVLKFLVPLGMTLKIAPISETKQTSSKPIISHSPDMVVGFVIDTYNSDPICSFSFSIPASLIS